MKKLVILLLTSLVAISTLFAQGAEEVTKETTRTHEGETLTVSMWGYNMDLLEKNIIKPFEDKYGCEVVIETGNNSSRFTKMVARKDNPVVDVAQFAGDWTYKAKVAGIIKPYDETKLSNLSAIIDKAKDPIGDNYGIGYAIGHLGLVYRTDKIAPVTSWKDLSRDDVSGLLAIPQITTTYGPSLIYMLSKAWSGDFNDTEAGWEKLEEMIPHLVTAYGRSSELNSLIAQEEVYIAPYASFTWGALSETGLPLESVIPEEGLVGSFSVVSVAAGTKNETLANLYIDHLISFDVQKAEAMDLVDSPVRSDIELSEEIGSKLTYGDELISSLNFFDEEEVSSQMEEWIDRWNKAFTK